MKKRITKILTCVVAISCALLFGAQTAFADTTEATQSLTTTYATNNSFSGNMFDIDVASQLVIDGFDIHVDTVGTDALINVYIRNGSYVGCESSPDEWTLVGTQTITSAGQGTPTPLNIGNIALEPGQQYGVYITVSDSAMKMLYTTGSNTYSDENMTITTGVGKGNPDFTGTTFPGRTWNGTIYYHIISTKSNSSNRIRVAETSFWVPVCNVISASAPNSVVEIDLSTDFVRMPGYVMETLRDRDDVTLVLTYGENQTLTIPGGNAQQRENVSFYSLAWLSELYA